MRALAALTRSISKKKYRVQLAHAGRQVNKGSHVELTKRVDIFIILSVLFLIKLNCTIKKKR